MKMKRCLSLVLSAVMVFTVAASFPVSAEEANQKEVVYAEHEEYTEALEDVSEELPENDELFEGYVNELFYGSYGIETFGNFAEEKLSPISLNIYRKLKENIQKIASGEISDTRMEFSAEEVGITKTEWTAEELGVSSVMKKVVVNGEEKWTITDEAMAAWREKNAPDLNLLLNYLLMDCPLDLYWYNKTAGTRIGVSYGARGYQGDEAHWNLTINGAIGHFPVAQEYQESSAAEPLYTVKTSLVQSAKTASDNAKAIVKKYEGYSDYDKLNNYRKEICDLVEYNTNAAENKTTPYGNPWQLIWVFDGDENTDVVCEGYSKAFQYLCDMTDFFSPHIRCYTVTGDMIGGTGAGGHMWNIVTMDDQKNYIVDITNCDGISIGAPDKLFLAGAVYKEIVDDEGTSYGNGYESAIEGQGPIKYVYDDSAVNMYGNSILQIADQKFTFEPKYSGRFGSDMAWTMDKDGFLNIKGTGDMPEAENVTDTKNAPWSVHKEEVTRVVVEEGITSVSNWAFAYFGDVSEISLPKGLKKIGMTAFAGSKIKKLEIPDSVEQIDALAFALCGDLTTIKIPGSVTTIEPGAFLGCNSLTSFTVDSSNQSFVFEDSILYNKNKTIVNFCLNQKNGSVVLPDTVTAINYYAFSGCSNLTSVTIPAGVKNIYDEAFKDCTSLKTVSFLGDCPVFSDTEASEGSPASSVFAGDDLTVYYPKDKEASWAERKEKGFAGAKQIVFQASCNTHQWADEYTVDKKATCTEAGSKSRHCKICGMIGDAEVIPAGHNYGEWSVKTQASCTEPGVRIRTCNTCGEEDTEEISATGHNWNSNFTTDIAAACTKPGSQSKHCSVCNEKDPATVMEIPATGHTLTKVTSKDGDYYLCSVCSKTFSDAEGTTEITIKKEEDKIQVGSISISAISTKIAAGKKVTLQAEVLPANASDKKLTWESSNPSYATVNTAGVVTTKKAGAGKSVTITAKAADGSGKSASITIKLMKDAVKKVKIQNAQKRLKAGRSMKLKAKITGTGKKMNKTIKWTSSNEKYATVSSKGVVKAKSTGKGKTVKITAMATDGSNKKATVKIKIN